MDAAKRIPEQQVLMEEKKKIEDLVANYNSRLIGFDIFDEGYCVQVAINGEDLPVKAVYDTMDEIDFEGFFVKDFCYNCRGMQAMLVPITQDEMNNFVWSYIEKYYPNTYAVRSLSIAIGVLEHMVEYLSEDVQQICKEYTKMLIQ